MPDESSEGELILDCKQTLVCVCGALFVIGGLSEFLQVFHKGFQALYEGGLIFGILMGVYRAPGENRRL